MGQCIGRKRVSSKPSSAAKTGHVQRYRLPSVAESTVKTFDALPKTPRQESPDSDLGSECDSLEDTDSACSELGRLAGPDGDPEANQSEGLDPSEDVVRALSPEDFVGTLKTPDLPDLPDRAFISSRLGRHVGSASNYDRQVSTLTESDILQWKKGEKIGSGSFGQVYSGLTADGELIAVKQLTLDMYDIKAAEQEYDKIYQEVSIFKSLNHKNIVKYLGSSFDDYTISIFMEYVPGGTLSHVVAKFGILREPIVARYTKQILEALNYLHQKRIVHRDVKSANIMLMPNGVVKLVDFGCATRLKLKLSNQLNNSIKGTPYWMAPEVINQTGHGKASDIWSLGCTAYEMLSGKPPWSDRNPIAAIYAIGSNKDTPRLPDTFSHYALDFVDRCLTRDKMKRPTASQLLLHDFIVKYRMQQKPKKKKIT